nr:hypothetical protein CFP56_39386 [Quercus suber]
MALVYESDIPESHCYEDLEKRVSLSSLSLSLSLRNLSGLSFSQTLEESKARDSFLSFQGFSGFLVADWAAGLRRKGGGTETFYGIELVEELKCRRRNWLSSSSESTMGQILVPSATRRPPL